MPVVLYGCETWPVILVLEHKLWVSENRVLRKTFWPKRDEESGGGENYITVSFMICTAHQILLGRSNQVGRGGQGISLV